MLTTVCLPPGSPLTGAGADPVFFTPLEAMDVMMVSPLPLLSLHIYPHTSLQEETFGPIVGIQKVSSDAEALALMNDTPYGLTASIWTDAVSHPESEDAFLRFVDGLSTGTVFLNR